MFDYIVTIQTILAEQSHSTCLSDLWCFSSSSTLPHVMDKACWCIASMKEKKKLAEKEVLQSSVRVRVWKKHLKCQRVNRDLDTLDVCKTFVPLAPCNSILEWNLEGILTPDASWNSFAWGWKWLKTCMKRGVEHHIVLKLNLASQSNAGVYRRLNLEVEKKGVCVSLLVCSQPSSIYCVSVVWPQHEEEVLTSFTHAQFILDRGPGSHPRLFNVSSGLMRLSRRSG